MQCNWGCKWKEEGSKSFSGLSSALKLSLPLALAGGARIGFHVGVFAAKLEGVFPFQKGDVVEKLEILVRPDELGPVAPKPGEACEGSISGKP